MAPLRSSRQRYLGFVRAYKERRLDDPEKTESASRDAARPAPAKRREYLRDYVRWLRPHRTAVVAFFFLALVAAALEMVEPLFMRFIVDRVLLNTVLDLPARLTRLHLAGAVFVGLVVVSSATRVLREYRQRLLNVRVMLSLRRTLFDRLLHLPLPTLWEMKTGGILSRLTGDVETTSGLLQMAIVSPSISLIRVIIAVTVLMVMNWRLALTALAIIPSVMVMSFAFSRRIRPIYRSVR
ncbi:MAG: ABC transporter ATP-binding protein, partial [Acidobacteriota bacterium]